MKIDGKNIQKYKYCNILLSVKISFEQSNNFLYLPLNNLSLTSFEIFLVMFYTKMVVITVKLMENLCISNCYSIFL